MFRVWQLSARKLTGDASIEELQELEQLLRDNPDLAIELELHGRFFNTKADQHTPEIQEAWRRQVKQMDEQFPGDFSEQKLPAGLPHRNHKRIRIALAAVAASLVLLFLFYQGWTGKSLSATQIAALNKKNEVVLPDGSKVILNKRSRLYLGDGFGKLNRDVTLDGEAFFDVAHDKDVPFIVHVATISIKVLGTAFNVRAYADEQNVQTSLIRGIIEVTDTRHKDMKMRMNPSEKITIGLGPLSRHEAGNSPPSKSESSDGYRIDVLEKEPASGVLPETAWTEEKLAFENETLEEVAFKLEKWYNVTIEIRGASLAQEKFTGILENQTVDDALRALQFTYPFKYKITGSKITIDE